MSSTFSIALSFALVIAIAALCREVRLRRAVQEIVRRLISYFSHLRRHADEAHSVDRVARSGRPDDPRVR